MSVAISWDNKMQLAKCDIMVGFPISSHIYIHAYKHTGMHTYIANYKVTDMHTYKHAHACIVCKQIHTNTQAYKHTHIVKFHTYWCNV